MVRDHSRESVNLPKTDGEMDKYQTLRALRDAFFLCGTGRSGGSFYLLDLAKTKRIKKRRARQYEETLLCWGLGGVDGAKEHHFFRSFPGFAPPSFWYKQYENKNENVRK